MTPTRKAPALGRLGPFTARRGWRVIGVWIALTLLGAVASGKLSPRWNQSSTVPGAPAYEGGQRTLAAFGAGVRAPNVVVFHTAGDATKDPAIEAAIQRAAAAMPGARTNARLTASRDRHTAFGLVYPPGQAGFDRGSEAEQMRV